MQGMHDNKKTRRQASVLFALLTMLSVIAAILVAAVIYFLLNGWLLRGPVAAVTGVLVLVTCVWMAALFRNMMVSVWEKIDRMTTVIETRLLAEPPATQAIQENRPQQVRAPREVKMVVEAKPVEVKKLADEAKPATEEKRTSEAKPEAKKKAEAGVKAEAEGRISEPPEAGEKAEAKPVTQEKTAVETRTAAEAQPEKQTEATESKAPFGSLLQMNAQEQKEEEFSEDELPEL